MKIKKILKLIAIESIKISFIYFLWGFFPIVYQNRITGATFYFITSFFWIFILFCLFKELRKNKGVKRMKQILLWSLFVFLVLILSLPVLRLVDIFKPIHPSIKFIVFGCFYSITYLTIVVFLGIKINQITKIKEDEPVQQILEWNKRIRDYPDEGIFYDSFGCGIISLIVNTILITVCFIFVVFQGIYLQIKDRNPINFDSQLYFYLDLILSSLFLFYSVSLFKDTYSPKRFRRQIIAIMLLLINIVYDSILYTQDKFNYYKIPILFQIGGAFIFILVKLTERFFQLRYITLKGKANMMEKIEMSNHTKLQDFLKYKGAASINCICGDRNLTRDFIDAAYELQLEMIKCGQLFKERKDYYDFVIRINICAYENASEACEDIKRKMKEYFNLKYGLIIGKKYIAELISRIKGISFLSGIIQKDDVSFFDKDCSRINVILDNYHGYYKNEEWTKKLCVFASKLNITMTFVSENNVEEPNESFIIETVNI